MYEALQLGLREEADAYLLDLRSNSGGLFQGAIEIVKDFIDDWAIVYISDSDGVRDVFEADGTAIVSALPLTLLVDKGTASASEVLAGALRDSRRARILGETTFGKGLIPTLVPLSDGSAVSVTVARYQTPSGTNINKVGIETWWTVTFRFGSLERVFCWAPKKAWGFLFRCFFIPRALWRTVFMTVSSSIAYYEYQQTKIMNVSTCYCKKKDVSRCLKKWVWLTECRCAHPIVLSEGTRVLWPIFFRCLKCASRAVENDGYTTYFSPYSFATFCIKGARSG